MSLRIKQEALTFDDVLLVPAHSTVLPNTANLSTQLTKEIRLNIPMLSAAMDTVTETKLAISLAQEGGIGFIHKNMTIERQADRVRKVKKFESGIVSEPVTVSPDLTLEALAEMVKKNGFAGYPVVDGENNLIGIITGRDTRFVKDLNKTVSQVMTKKERLVTVKEGATRDEILALMHEHRVEKVLVVDDAFKLKGMITVKGAIALADAGASAVKVGIGPGSICTTRIVTGVGVPQITAIADAAAALKDRGIPVIADGGIRFSGDIAKAIAAGASCVMVGSMFAGTEEAPGEIELYQGRAFKSYRGMGSLGAMAKGSSDRYFQSDNAADKLVPEGIEGRIPYKGYLKEIIHQQMGGLRSCMGLTGCATIEELRTKAEFVRISGAGIKESHVHDVTITKEAPNYRMG